MSDHLPECPYPYSRCPNGCERTCICDDLRACEQRTLAAARDAVAALPQHWPNSPALHRGTALAAIDALREGK